MNVCRHGTLRTHTHRHSCSLIDAHSFLQCPPPIHLPSPPPVTSIHQDTRGPRDALVMTYYLPARSSWSSGGCHSSNRAIGLHSDEPCTLAGAGHHGAHGVGGQPCHEELGGPAQGAGLCLPRDLRESVFSGQDTGLREDRVLIPQLLRCDEGWEPMP